MVKITVTCYYYSYFWRKSVRAGKGYYQIGNCKKQFCYTRMCKHHRAHFGTTSGRVFHQLNSDSPQNIPRDSSRVPDWTLIVSELIGTLTFLLFFNNIVQVMSKCILTLYNLIFILILFCNLRLSAFLFLSRFPNNFSGICTTSTYVG